MPSRLSHDNAIAQDWMRAIATVRKDVPLGSLPRFDAVTDQYISSLYSQGIDVSKLDLEV